MVGGKKPDLRLLRQRKADGRDRQHRHALEIERRAFGLAYFFFVVDADAGGLEHPVGHPAGAGAALAGGVGGVADDGALVVQEVNALGLAVGVVFQEAVARLVEKAFKRIDLELQQRAFKGVARAVDATLPRALARSSGW
jgi:hypothetical protein